MIIIVLLIWSKSRTMFQQNSIVSYLRVQTLNLYHMNHGLHLKMKYLQLFFQVSPNIIYFFLRINTFSFHLQRLISYLIMEPQQQKLPQKNTFQFSEGERTIVFSSDFDGGNISRVSRCGANYYQLWTGADCEGTNQEGYSRSWFYFSVTGFKSCKAVFVLNRIQVLWSLLRCPEKYRPVYRIQGTQWKRLPHDIRSLVTNRQNEVVLTFDFSFPNEDCRVQFAFIFPYTYQNLQDDLAILQQKHQNRAQYYFKRSLLIKSPEGRNVDCIVLSSHDGKEGFQSIKDDNILKESKLCKFKSNKPVILITSRVHPLQTPSSFVMNGIIDFLTNFQDARSYILMKNFVFLLVPMLNPDGVARGHCRMDIFNQNLNRYYNTPDLQKQPSCYAIRKLAEYYTSDKRLFFYLDLHAHPANKGNFVFGNAIYDYVMQVESTLFPKLLSENCCNFQFQQCNFSRKHMTAKDRFQQLNKQGCGRVVFYKDFGLVHAYTLQCGYHANIIQKSLLPIQNKDLKFIVKKKQIGDGQLIFDLKPLDRQGNIRQKDQIVVGLLQQDLDNFQYSHYKQPVAFYTQDVFKNLGKNILVTLLDIWNKNPYPRVQDPNISRKELASQNRKLDRFRRQQTHLKTKQQNIVQLIQQQFYSTWRKKNVFSSQRIKVSSLVQVKRAMTMTKQLQSRSMCQKQKQIKGSSKYKFITNLEGQKQQLKEMQKQVTEDNKQKGKDIEKEGPKLRTRYKQKEPKQTSKVLFPQQFDDGSLFMKYTYRFRITKKS